MLFSLFILLGTPFIQIIYLIRRILSWFGLAIALFSVIVNVFLNEGLDIVYILQSSFIGFIFLSIGSGIYSAALHQISLLPFIFSTLLILISAKIEFNEKEAMETNNPSISSFFVVFSAIILMLLPLIGVIPFNSVLFTLTYIFYSLNFLAPIGLSSGGLLTLIITFFICLIFIRRVWKKRRSIMLSPIQKYTILSLVLVFILTCAFFPIFFLQNYLGPSIILRASEYLVNVIPLLVSYFVIFLLYFITTKFLTDLNRKILSFFTPARKIIRSFYYFDFIFYASNWCWLKVIKPISIWTYNIIIVGFLYQIITISIIKFIAKILSVISISLTDYIEPFIKKIFVNLSKFFLRLEHASLRRQLQLAALFIFAILLTFVLYYIGGNIQ
jgi:hypothetical protein